MNLEKNLLSASTSVSLTSERNRRWAGDARERAIEGIKQAMIEKIFEDRDVQLHVETDYNSNRRRYTARLFVFTEEEMRLIGDRPVLFDPNIEKALIGEVERVLNKEKQMRRTIKF